MQATQKAERSLIGFGDKSSLEPVDGAVTICATDSLGALKTNLDGAKSEKKLRFGKASVVTT